MFPRAAYTVAQLPPASEKEVGLRVPQGRRPWLLALVTAWSTLGHAAAVRLQAEGLQLDVSMGASSRMLYTPSSSPPKRLLSPIVGAFSGGIMHPATWPQHEGFVIPRQPLENFPEVSGADAGAQFEQVAPPDWPAAWRADLSSVAIMSETPRATTYVATLKPRSKLATSTSGRVMVKEMKVMANNPEVVLTKRKDVKALREIAIVKKFSGGGFLKYINSTSPAEWQVGLPMLLMTEAPAGTLQDLVVEKSRVQVSYQTRVRLIIDLLRAMDVFHGAGFAFRGLTAEHIYIVGDCENFIGPRCRLKLGDLSSAVGLPGTGEPYEQPSPDAMRAHHVFAAGSMEHWPPEMLRSQAFDPQQQDAYSVGLLMRDMLVQNGGNSRTNPVRAIAGYFVRRPVPVAAARKVTAVMQGLLHQRPENRIPIWEALEELEGIARHYHW